MYDLLGVYPHLFCEVGFDGGALHADGTFRRGKMRQQPRCINLCVMDPSGTAACELRKRTVFLRNTLDQFAGFFHNGEVCCKVCIQHIICAQGTKQCNHFPFHEGAGLHTELFTECGADGRGSAEYHDFFRIGYRLSDILAFIALCNAVYRTNVGALSTVNTDGFSAGFVQSVSAMHPHQLGTDIFAHAATNTLFFPAYNAGIVRFNRNADG